MTKLLIEEERETVRSMPEGRSAKERVAEARRGYHRRSAQSSLTGV